MTTSAHDPSVTKIGLLDMQVCVPAAWSDQQIVDFANLDNPAGTASGWLIRREGDEALAGAHERVTCAANPAQVHVMLDC